MTAPNVGDPSQDPLDRYPGNLNEPGIEQQLRSAWNEPLDESGDSIRFRFYMEAPLVVDWLADRGVTARFEQRHNEGVSIVLPNGRAYVGNTITVVDGQASVSTSKA